MDSVQHDVTKSSITNEEEYIIYPYRWWILVIFCLLVMANALLWVTFAPISDLTSSYFGKGYYGSTTSVNMLANIFLILYGPGGLTLIGSFIRYMAALNHDSLSNKNKYILIMIGQAFAAISQPMFLNSPPAIASIWFAVKERDLATTIGSMCSPIGNAIGQIIPVILVSGQSKSDDDDDDYNVKGMNDLMLAEFILCIIPFLLAIILLKDAPPTPPSKSTKLKNENLNRTIVMVSSSSNIESNDNSFKIVDDNYSKVYDDVKELLCNRDFILLFFAFSIGVGFFNSLLTLLNQIVAPFGYSNDNAGTFGAVFIVFGLVGAGCGSYLMEHTRAYRTILKCGVLLCIFACFLFISMLYSNNFWPLTISFSVLGFFILPLLPVMMENCAECTYPISEDLSMGILFVGSNIIGLGFIFALQYLIDVPAFGPPPLLPSNFFIIGIIICAFIIAMLYQGKYRRLENESLRDQLIDQTDFLLSNTSNHNIDPLNTTSNNDSNKQNNIYNIHSPIQKTTSSSKNNNVQSQNVLMDGTIVHITSMSSIDNDNNTMMVSSPTSGYRESSDDNNIMNVNNNNEQSNFSASIYAWRNNSQSTNSQTMYSQNSLNSNSMGIHSVNRSHSHAVHNTAPGMIVPAYSGTNNPLQVLVTAVDPSRNSIYNNE